MSRVVIRDLEKFPGLEPVSIVLLYPGSQMLLMVNIELSDMLILIKQQMKIFKA